MECFPCTAEPPSGRERQRNKWACPICCSMPGGYVRVASPRPAVDNEGGIASTGAVAQPYLAADLRLGWALQESLVHSTSRDRSFSSHCGDQVA